MSEIIKLANQFRVDHGKTFRLKNYDPGSTAHLHSKERAKELLQESVLRMAELQNRLYAQDQWSLLLIFQALDAAGKDSAIKHVMSGVNPQGCQVYSFKVPSSEELDHDYLWRNMVRLPARGHIGIFNRSYYEEVLVVRVHPEVLRGERVPPSLVTKHIWNERFEDIHAFERYLSRNGTIIRKFFLNVSKKEQKQRFLDRLDEPEKNWKFSGADVHERAYWDDYMAAYEDAIRHTANKQAPWYVVPADNKWFTRLVVASVIVETLEELKLHYPIVPAAKRGELTAARESLEGKIAKAKRRRSS